MDKKLNSPVLAIVMSLAIAQLGITQTTTATLSGTISDATGGVLPGAQVVVTNTSTGVKRTTPSDERGRFVVAQLAPGPYELSVSIAGFDTLLRQGITL